MKVPEPRKLSSGNWFIQLRLNGESVPVTAPTAKECKDAAALIKAEHRVGKRAQNLIGADKTLTQAIDDYIAARSNTLSPSTIRGYFTIRNNRFKGVMDKKLKDITDWQKICNNEAKLCSAKTLKNSYRFIVSVLSENGVQPQKVTLPQVVSNERPWLDYEQILTFCEAAKDQPGELAALLALNSLRRSEMCALTWDSFDMKRKSIKVKGAKVPNDKHQYVVKETNKNATSARVVPILIPRIVDLISPDNTPSEYIVTVRPDTLRNQINRICKLAGLPEVGVHGLRHSFASLAYHLGMPEKECMRIGGWADTQTMHNIYTHLAENDTSKYQNIMTDFYKNANQNANKIKKFSIISVYEVD